MTLWTVAHQAPLSMRVSKQEYWSGLSVPPPGNLPDSGIKPRSPALQAGSLISSDRDAFPLLVQETHFPHGIFISCFQEDKGWSTCIFCTTVSQVTLFFFYFIFKLYITVLVLPNIKMNPPQVYMCLFVQRGSNSWEAFLTYFLWYTRKGKQSQAVSNKVYFQD